MKADLDRPKDARGFALAGLLASATAYALWLNTGTGRKWADEQTWATVAAGVALTTAWTAAEDAEGAKRSLLYFCVSGVPIVLRSLWLQLERMERVFEREMSA